MLPIPYTYTSSSFPPSNAQIDDRARTMGARRQVNSEFLVVMGVDPRNARVSK